jgi:adenosylcobinamide-phosphate synthase
LVPELSFYVQLILVLSADLLLGDPRWTMHPVRLIGRLCESCESFARRRLTWLNARTQGCVSFLLVLAATAAATVLILNLLGHAGRNAVVVGGMVIAYFAIAAGDLLRHSRAVRQLLGQNDISAARAAVGLMVGRDTADLNATEINRACIESVSENIVDGVTAPLFWAFVFSLLSGGFFAEPLAGGVLGLMTYKAVNTMDSMYGYKNERYIEFGWLAARIDDICNFIPARLTGICLVGAAFLPGFDGCGAARVFIADRLKSSSPNSGHSEAAVAGGLGIRLGGESRYFGQVHVKPVIGAGLPAPATDDILRSNRLAVAGSLIFFTLCCFSHLIAQSIL